MTKRRAPSFAKIVGAGLAHGLRGLTMLLGKRTGTRAAAHAASLLPPIAMVSTPKGSLRFWCATASSAKRAANFLRDEPETLAWIDNHLKPGQCLWDVGANVGAYSLYAGLTDNVTIESFEPVAGTFALLARNVEINGLGRRIAPLCIALSNVKGLTPIYLSSSEAGSAMHALGEPRTVRGRFEAAGTQTVAAIRADSAIDAFGLTPPDHVKIDVDGHELAVLQGMSGMLSGVRTIWIEMTAFGDPTGENARIEALLSAFDFSACAPAAGAGGRNRLFANQRFFPAA
jgi:FkbM family methyltransferase